ncbi:MAG: hypothetical protein GY720_05320 [bacterium]|nr:hypothetical protein [bacterium]
MIRKWQLQRIANRVARHLQPGETLGAVAGFVGPHNLAKPANTRVGAMWMALTDQRILLLRPGKFGGMPATVSDQRSVGSIGEVRITAVDDQHCRFVSIVLNDGTFFEATLTPEAADDLRRAWDGQGSS